MSKRTVWYIEPHIEGYYTDPDVHGYSLAVTKVVCPLGQWQWQVREHNRRVRWGYRKTERVAKVMASRELATLRLPDQEAK